jgi:hypothetical protein
MSIKSFNQNAANRQSEIVVQTGRFRGNGGVTTDNSLNKGMLDMTVVRNDVGDYTVTFEDVGVELLHVDAKVWVPSLAGNNKRAVPGPYDATARTLEVYVYDADAGTASDPADDDDSWVSLELTWQNTDVAQ